MSTSASTHATGERDRLRVVDDLASRRPRDSGLWSILVSSGRSIVSRIRSVVRSIVNARWVRRVLRHLGRAASVAITSIRTAVPVSVIWLLSSATFRGALAATAVAAGRAVRETAHLSSDVITWLLWRFGGAAQTIAREYAFLVERGLNTVEALVARIGGWLAKLPVEHPVLGVIHHLSAGYLVVLVMLAFVPSAWRITAAAVGGSIAALPGIGDARRLVALRQPSSSASDPLAPQSTASAREPSPRSRNAKRRSKHRR